MELKEHNILNIKIAEVKAEHCLINNIDDGLNLLGSVYYGGFDGLIIHSKNIVNSFFDLSTGMAGEILQKFSNYRMSLVIVGDFVGFNSKSLNDFIRESNKLGHVIFVETIEHALAHYKRTFS